jgi:hypothetical protein
MMSYLRNPGVQYWYRCPLDKAAVARARRATARLGWRVAKSRQRYQHTSNKGGLQLIDDWGKIVGGLDYSMTPEDVIAACRSSEPPQRQRNCSARLEARKRLGCGRKQFDRSFGRISSPYS